MQTTSTIASKVVEEVAPTLVLTIKASVIRLAKRYHSRVRSVAMYALEITMLDLDKNKNIFMRHKSLPANASYLFQAFPHMNLATKELVTAISAVIESNQGAIPVSNFGLIPSKIRRGQALG